MTWPRPLPRPFPEAMGSPTDVTGAMAGKPPEAEPASFVNMLSLGRKIESKSNTAAWTYIDHYKTWNSRLIKLLVREALANGW